MEMKDKLEKVVAKIEEELQSTFMQRGKVSEANQRKVLKAFRDHEVSEYHFHGSTGYGYDDIGRETLEKIYAQVFGGESAIVRPQIVSGTHAISTALFGVLRPGDELLYITGKPYDTLEEVIGVRGNKNIGSLADLGVTYQYVPLKNDEIDFKNVKRMIHENTKIIGIQRSKGYENRPSFTIKQMQEMINYVKEINPELIVFVDNCYGEFVELEEPNQVGADIVAGSLIKNPGGGLVKTGGYIVGKEHYIQLCAARLTAPGIGLKGGASLHSLLEMFQGLFLAPHVVNQALKGALFTAKFLSHIGMETSPSWTDERTDLIQSVSFPSRETMIAFCQAIQANSPVDAHVKPQPSYMPGYEDDVIMAAGTFIQGASIELTADGPIRPPYTAYVQGGLTYEHVKICVTDAVYSLIKNNLFELNLK
ncbi:aminotransferase class I/II-fold pyridoxal phosphate-dependent enzyme [Evansella cellulosilytica]|uniref:Aluminum resistance family protein n=1 Tax=Evansella cellulosilytica (strain ATCC 21833 / DSM 2522 / FERM P-1141 / JCM 9156 / N-4) TaxID=649639 RepID=E6TS12_EVAC2|nr:methionine gamma-lyase family protein [Evansella cellulosilytica]ADU30666.1 aluminum resistance family protein [Evansella cellulosilytica DSM 2522]